MTEPLQVGRALALPVALALIAGFVDTVGFLHLFGVFSANQSGNVVLLGIALAGASDTPAWSFATAIIAFMSGTALGVWTAGRVRPIRRAPLLLAIELALLVAIAVIAVAIDADRTALDERWQAPLLIMAGVAMGIQTEVIRRVAGVTVATTYQTGAIAHIGETAATLPGTVARAAALRMLVILGAVLIGYIVGAALGASRLGQGHLGFIAPCGAIAVALVATLLAPGIVTPEIEPHAAS